MIFVFTLPLLVVLALSAWIFLSWRVGERNRKISLFIREHSIALRRLREINARHTFLPVVRMDMEHTYDNENMYVDISPRDYLIYQLVYRQKDARDAIAAAEENRKLFAAYRQEVNASCVLGSYDSEDYPCKQEEIEREERSLFASAMLRPPVMIFTVTVYLCLIYMNGRLRDRKANRFTAQDIEDILQRLSQKRDGYYLDEAIWHAICRVERGKVSNRMRFAIYQRDGYRCRKCGRATDDLEIDHIFPISKGGKTTLENLQTLCHRCNTEKSNMVEAEAIIPRRANATSERICQNCGVPLVLRHGRNGSFYGCMNYPNCRYTEKI